MTENEFTYWAFLCYSQQDNCKQHPDAPGADSAGWGDWLHAALKTFSIPAIFAGQINARGESVPPRIAPVFQDLEEQSDNASLSESVRLALDQSKCLVVICSPRSARSLHVNEAVRYFKQLGRGNRILSLVIAGEPNATDGHKPGMSPDAECFVPALRHPVKPDGTLDVSRRELGSIFADARQGDSQREILAQDHQTGAIELETAKIQLIAGLIGVGFNGLWGHEIKRLFAAAKHLTREAPQPIPQTETRNLVPETHTEILAAQNQTREAQQQIQEHRNQAQAAQSKIIEAQRQVREALGQVAEARDQAQAAERKVLEAQQQARDAQTQLEESRSQVREAQSKILEVQNLPQDVKSQIEEAQTKARDAQSQIAEARNQAQKAQGEVEAACHEARDTQNKFLEAQNQVSAAQSLVQEMENQTRQTQSQLEAAQNQARMAESKIVEAQQQAREAQSQVEQARNQVREAQSKIQETQNQARATQRQLEEARNEARAVQNKFLEAQNQVRTAQTQVQEIQTKSQAARRLTRIFAVMAVLALMAAASVALWQQKKIAEAQAKAASVAASEPALVAGPLNREQIQQALQKFASASNDPNLLRSLDELATRIPTEEISETLNVATVILNDPQRSHFQEQLVDCWMKTNLPAAFDWSCQLTNVDSRQRALEKIIPAVAADNLTNTLARLNDLKPVPSELIYIQLFLRWAAQDPVQAIEQRQLIPGQYADGQILSAIISVWADQQPAAALSWLQSQPDSESLPTGTLRNTMIAGLFDRWAAKDLDAATTACQQLPDSTAKEKAWGNILSQRMVKAPESAAESVKNLPLGDYRQKAIVELCNHWVGATNAPAVLDWAQSLPSEAERIAITNRVIINWAQNDPQAATQFAGQHSELPSAVLGEIASVWFQRDVAATTNWVASLPDGEKKDAARFALVETWAQNDPKGMVAYALALPAGDVQTRYLTAASRQLAVNDLPRTVELLQPLADAALRQNMLEQAARSCDLSQLNQAAKYIAAMPAGDDQKAAIKGLVSTWVPADPEVAVNWLVSFPETNSQPELVQSVIKTWSQPEPSVVAKWLANLPAGTASEGMVGAFLEGASVKYPDYAAQWTQSMTDENQRQKYQIQVARQWLKTDSSAATKWIESLSLPEDIKQSLKASLP
jgi:predicted  nucleic acid-binding Zn-ribbon protein